MHQSSLSGTSILLVVKHVEKKNQRDRWLRVKLTMDVHYLKLYMSQTEVLLYSMQLHGFAVLTPCGKQLEDRADGRTACACNEMALFYSKKGISNL